MAARTPGAGRRIHDSADFAAVALDQRAVGQIGIEARALRRLVVAPPDRNARHKLRLRQLGAGCLQQLLLTDHTAPQITHATDE